MSLLRILEPGSVLVKQQGETHQYGYVPGGNGCSCVHNERTREVDRDDEQLQFLYRVARLTRIELVREVYECRTSFTGARWLVIQSGGGPGVMKSTTQQAEKLLVEAYLQCKSYLARIVSLVVESQDVEDIVQETFLKSYEASSKSEIRHPKSYMVRTATNLALNWVRKADRQLTQPLGDFPESSVLSGKESAEDRAVLEQRLLIFCRAAQRMPLQCRRAYILKKVYGLRRKEIAKYMGLSEKTVQNHIAKGTLMCAEYVKTHGVPIAARNRARGKAQHG